MTEKAVIPPVQAGSVNSSIDINYGSQRGVCEARSRHEWTFDISAYAQQTRLDIGKNYPYVAQENGHVLAVITEIRVAERSNGGYTVWVEQEAVRGLTSYNDVFWSKSGGYDLDQDLVVEDTFNEKQQYKYREKDVPQRKLPQYNGTTFTSIEQMVNKLHNHPDQYYHDTLQEIIEMDSPDHALKAAAVNYADNTERTANAD